MSQLGPRHRPGAGPVSSRELGLGLGVQALATYVGFGRPQLFWGALPVGLGLSGLPALRRLAGASQPASRRWLLAGLAAGAGGYGLTAILTLPLTRLEWGRAALVRLQRCFGAAPRPLAGLLALPAALAEEAFWRQAMLFPADRGDPWSRLPWVTLAYCLIQCCSLEPLPPLGAVLLGSGGGWLRIRSGSIWPPVLAHAVYTELCLVKPGLPRAPSLAGS
ncbi:MAG: CPBP family glutamic-type intramembrane protease [Candidatus Dormibacteria bacterium]